MRRKSIGRLRLMSAAVFFACWAFGEGAARGQQTASAPAPTSASAQAPADRLNRIEEQLRQLEARNQQLQSQYDALMKKYEDVQKKNKVPVFGAEANNPDGMGIPGGLFQGPDTPEKETESVGTKQPGEVEPQGSGGLHHAGSTRQRVQMYRIGLFWFRDDSKEIVGRGPYVPDMPALEHKMGANAFLGGRENGATWFSSDKYFSLTFHNLTQLDLREPIQQGDPLHGGFIIPRQRWYFEGTVGDYANFVTSVNRGYASFDVLDAYSDFIVNPEWLMFRVGRMKTPSQYEYISIDEANLIGPERSLFVQSFAGNRQLGAMAHGRLFDRRIEYYAGAFNGQRRSFEDFNSGRDYFFYLDYRPFIQSGIEWLSGLHMVVTDNFGEERQPLSPIALRTMNQLSNSNAAAFVSPTILEFSNAAFENGPRNFWSYETVYYYKSFGFLAGVQGGYQDYSLLLSTTPSAPKSGTPASSVTSPYSSTRQNANNEFLDVNSPTRTHVPIMGWSFQTWYFLTGEQITRRRYLVEPKNPYGYYEGYIHPGALELFGKVTDLQLGDSIFRGGIANRALWTNRAFAPEIGINWYLTHFVKFTFDYQHVFLGNPVVLDEARGTFTKNYDLFMFRTQLFF